MNISDLVPWKSNERGGQVAVRRGSYPSAFQNEFNRLFEDFFENSGLTPWSERFDGFNPRVNVAEREKEIEVTAELPGIAEEDVDISLTRDVLTIKGEKKQESERKEDNYTRVERSYGSFSRTISLPADVVDADNVEATFKNGVLTIVLPKREEAQQVSRRIAVKAG